jgi:CubicO group peptidase (beta-lactamase class C family)
VAQYVRRQVDEKKAPMMQLLVMRHGRLAFRASAGFADLERQTPLRDDTLMRIYSMTKPIVSAMAMILVERAQIQLDDPLSNYLPCFAAMRVHDEETGETRPARSAITLQHLVRGAHPRHSRLRPPAQPSAPL